jgi:hypothetical protein
MAHFNLDNYETVEDRLVKFWHDHPDGRIATMMEDITADKSMVVFRCDVYFNADDARPKASGYAEETRNSSPVNKTSFVENCETSAIGRALANCGYAAKGSRPSREEMEKVQRAPQAPVQSAPQFTSAQVVSMFEGAKEVSNAPKPAPTIKNPGATASDKQLGMIRSMIRGKGMTEEEGVEFVGTILQRQVESLSTILMGEASTVITSLKNIPTASLPPEAPF